MPRRFMLAAVAAVAALAAPAVARADAITQWNLNASTALMVTAGQGPQLSVPHMAMVHGAVYDAVNAIDGGHEGYLLTSRVATPFDSKEAAAATAAYQVLLNLVPAQKATLDAQYAASLASVPDGTAKTRGIAVGERRGGRHDRGAHRRRPLRRVSVPGRDRGRPVAARPAGLRERPVRMAEGCEAVPDQERHAVPLARTGSAREQALRTGVQRGQVARICDEHDSVRRPDAGGALLGGEPAGDVEPHLPHAVGAAGGVARRQRPPLRDAVHERGRCADHGLERQGGVPLLAPDHGDPGGRLRRQSGHGGRCGLAAADPDAALHRALVWPRGLSGAIVATLQDFFGTDHIGWSDTNNGGFTRSYTQFSDAIAEIIEARIWSGIHFRSADEQGAKIGKQVAQYRERALLRAGAWQRRLGERPRSAADERRSHHGSPGAIPVARHSGSSARLRSRNCRSASECTSSSARS